MTSIQREVVWSIMLISVVMGVNLTCVTWSDYVTYAALCRSALPPRPHLVAINASNVLRWLHHLEELRGGQIPPSYSPAYHYRSRNWTFPSGPKKETNQKGLCITPPIICLCCYLTEPRADTWAEEG